MVNKSSNRASSIIVIALVFFTLIALFLTRGLKTAKNISYPDFQAEIQAGSVLSPVLIKVGDKGKTIKGQFLKEDTKEFFYTFTARQDLYEFLDDQGFGYKEEAGSSFNWGSFLLTLLMFLGPLVVIFYLLSRMSGAGTGTKDIDKLSRNARKEKSALGFNDVAGQEEAVEETRELVDFLQNRNKFLSLGARLPKGVLLTGPPGTGKTLLARAIAGEAGVPFFAVSGSEFVQLFVGVGASRVRDLFNQAKSNAPCIVFIDELDAVGRHRGAGIGGGNDEREQTLNQILVEMDGFDVNINIIVLAATNRPDILDPALLRPGRFDRKIILASPDLNGREAILKVHAKGKPIQDGVSIKKLAQKTFGFSGADLESMINEAAILAVRRQKSLIGEEEFSEAIERVVAGPQRKSRVFSSKEKEIIAFHEAGHAVVGWVLPNVDPLHKISIMARGNVGGYTKFLPEEDRFFLTKSQLKEMVSAMLGGRLAEELQFGEPSTGAENDLDVVRGIVWRMVTRYGMADDLPPQAFGKVQEMIFLGREISEQRDYGDEIASKIDKARIKIIEEAYQTAKTILTQYKEKLIEIAKELIEKETLEGEELQKFFNSLPKNQWPPR